MTSVCLARELPMISFTNSISCDSHDLNLRKPCCNGNRRLWCSRCVTMFLVMMCSRSLLQINVKDIGLQFATQSLSPFLKMGVTRAFLQSSGTWWVDKDLLKIICRTGASTHESMVVFLLTSQIRKGREGLFYGRKKGKDCFTQAKVALLNTGQRYWKIWWLKKSDWTNMQSEFTALQGAPYTS